MASSSQAIDLSVKLQWREIRDLLVGVALHEEQNVKLALEFASTCQHPEAQWLTEIFAGKDVTTPAEAKKVFLAHETDPRALCFAAVVDLPIDEELVYRSAELGCAYAQSWTAYLLSISNGCEQKRFSAASLAALQGECEGYYELGRCFLHGVGCEIDLGKARLNFFMASTLWGDPVSCDEYGDLLSENDPERWRYWGMAAKKGYSHSFVNSFAEQVELFDSDPSLARVVFMIGRYLRGHVDLEKKEIFGNSYEFSSRIVPANRAIDFFVAQCAAARKAVDMWCLIARRIAGESVNRDIRKKIGMLIWEERELTLYRIN
jgi:hypothetical protein